MAIYSVQINKRSSGSGHWFFNYRPKWMLMDVIFFFTKSERVMHWK